MRYIEALKTLNPNWFIVENTYGLAIKTIQKEIDDFAKSSKSEKWYDGKEYEIRGMNIWCINGKPHLALSVLDKVTGFYTMDEENI